MLTLEEKLSDTFDASILNYQSIEEMIHAWEGDVFITSGDIGEERCYVVFERDHKEIAISFISHKEIIKARPKIQHLIPPPPKSKMKVIEEYDRVIDLLVRPKFDEILCAETISLSDAIDIAVAHTLKNYGYGSFSRTSKEQAIMQDLPPHDYIFVEYTVYCKQANIINVCNFAVDLRAHSCTK